MPEIDFEHPRSDKQALAVLKTEQDNQALVKANRLLAVIVFVLLFAVFAMGSFLIPDQDFWTNDRNPHAARGAINDAVRNPALSDEVNALKGQMFGLVSGSIESKLRTLEENIKRGSVAESLNTIHDLKTDVKVLTTYGNNPGVKPAPDNSVNQAVISELAELKSLVYLTFVSCGLMIAGLAAIWLRNKYRLTHQKNHLYLGKIKRG
ncbi:MAG: hypothetical protein CTY22_00545 [Methylomonas sp.]|nr:MAG: hypothetical protein CTY23_01665 [Methylomonas sp.]PPD27987.1 MAG: hypothetical protein CTY22_00545 [Methylomonas sp.]PPD40095.1 MAG: hypothetical protein CTY21_00545 [Methylomonas sp.]PPD41601.1 MAG: hypothetical protein CTY17_03605 [Methylomonas sp.]PPD52066.1 MAG: hypothetical protein CTY11_10140 [Methylomonas sp.]